MSILSKIFNCYKESLDSSINRYQDSYNLTSENGLKFYNDFLNELFIDYGEVFSKPHTMSRISEKIADYFQKDDIQFVAIDGTCSADPFNDFMVFFAAAYGVRGRIHLNDEKKKLSYERWSMDQDVSLVAYVPVPYAESGDVTNLGDEEFLVDDTNKINLSKIHTRLMELAEIYLAYEMARSSTLTCPKLILMDLSLSSVMMSTDGYLEDTHLFGHPIGSRKLEKRDGLVVFSHPFNEGLGLPTSKEYRRWAYLVGVFSKNKGKPIKISDLIIQSSVSAEEWKKSLNQGTSRDLFSVVNDEIVPKFDFAASWFDSVRFFEDFCDRLFHKRDSDSLLYPVMENGYERLRWMSPEDISFLISIGIRALIEACWEKNILLVGIAKDSSSKFFSRNYLGIMREIGKFPKVDVGYLPWTDRSLLESISYQVDSLKAPWAISEFDSVFMSLHLEEDENKKRYIRGNRGYLINQERLFARSLAQFYKTQTNSKQLMGHVIFIDRLIDPKLDSQIITNSDNMSITGEKLGTINPLFFGTNKQFNYGQAIEIWLLNLLTRNLFPEVIGYPDPLHKADWGAKTVKRKVDRLIKSSEITFRTKPLQRTFRTIRDSARR
jgi:hypothetical protein